MFLFDDKKDRPNSRMSYKAFNHICCIEMFATEVKVREIADIIKIPTERVKKILHKRLHIKRALCKMCAAFSNKD